MLGGQPQKAFSSSILPLVANPQQSKSTSCSSNSRQSTPITGVPLLSSSAGGLKKGDESSNDIDNILDDDSIASLPSSISSKHSENSKTLSTKSTATMTVITIAPNVSSSSEQQGDGIRSSAVVSVGDEHENHHSAAAAATTTHNTANVNHTHEDDENDVGDDNDSDRVPLPPLESTFNRHPNTSDMIDLRSVNTTSATSMRSSVSSSTRSQTSLVAGANAKLFDRIENDFEAAMISRLSSSSPATLKVCKLCFAALSVVFVETAPVPSNRSAAAPFQYTRLPSIPAGAARMLWKALIGSDGTDENTNESSTTKITTRDVSLTAEDAEAFFAVMKSHRRNKTDRSTSVPAEAMMTMTTAIRKQPRRMSLNNTIPTSTKSLDEFNHCKQKRRFSASWTQRAETSEQETMNHNTPTNNGAKQTASQVDSMHPGENTSEEKGRRSEYDSFRETVDELQKKKIPPSSWLLNMIQNVTEEDKQRLRGETEQPQPQQQQQQQEPLNIDPFLSFIRDNLIKAGTIDLAGRTNDFDNIYDRYDSTKDLGRAFASDNDTHEKRSLGTADSFSLQSYESATGFVGWKKHQAASATTGQKKRIRRRTQYIQIQRDMQHQYGVYLSGLPIEEGGFAISSKSSSSSSSPTQTNIDEEDDLQDETMDVLKRQHDTMKRWNDVMATACLEKEFRNSADFLKSGIPMFSPPLPNSITVDLSTRSLPVNLSVNDGGPGATPAAAAAAAAAAAQDPELTQQPSQLPQVEDQKRPWVYEQTEVWPIDDAILYSLRMLPSHLMRAGRVKEASKLLSTSRDFFLGRVYALGAERAVARHRDDINELERRVDMALEGYVDVGGDGSTVNMKQVIRRSMRIIIESLVTEYAHLETVYGKDDAHNRVDDSKNGASDSCVTGTTASTDIKRKGKKKVKGEKKKGEMGRSLHIIAWYLGTKGYSDEAVACYKMALDYKYASVGQNDVSVAGTLHNMGNLYLDRGEHRKAIECYKGALRVEQKKLGSNNMKTANTLNNLGMVYGMTCQYDKAAECYKDALEVEKAELGNHHLKIAETLNDLGIIHGMRGDYDEAVNCYKECLRIKQRKLGPQHDECSETLFNLGIVHNKRGDYEAAVDCYQDALRARKAKMGEDHVEVARILHCLGLVLNDMGELENSTRCYEESLRIQLLKLGDDHEDVARTLYNLGHVYNKSGDYDRAMECFKGTLRVSKRKLGSKHEKISDTLHSMGLVFHKKGSLDNAMECYHEALKIRKEKRGPDDLGVASTLHNMGDVQYMRNKMTEAMECYEGAFRIRFFKLGIDNVDVAATRNNIGVVHLKNGENHKAMECFKEALRVRELRLGSVHEKCGDTLHNMGLAHKNLMEYEEAIRRYEQALCIRKLKLGGGNVKIADTLYNMAIVYANSGRYSSALDRYKEALRAYRETGLSDSHPSVANTLQWIRWAQKQIK